MGITTLIISNEETNIIIKIVKSLKGSGLLIKGISVAIQNKVKEQKVGLLSMLLQLWTKYLRQTLVFMWNSALQEKFNFYFGEGFC